MGIEFNKSSLKKISIFTLVMINVIAVDNLRSLTIGAQFGTALVFFYVLAALLFFIPTILVTAELATGWPTIGGVYIWVREAFGPRWGFLTIWLQWIYNVVWYPTIFAFMAGVSAYLIHPELATNKVYMLSFILSAFWLATFINFFGVHISSWLSTIGALVGTILPMVLIAILGITWMYLGKPLQISFTPRSFFPNLANLENLAFFTNILFGLMGMEMSAVHAEDVENPTKNYPRALLIASVIILTTLVLACLAITIVVPLKELSLVSGLIDAFRIFFRAYHMEWFIPIIAGLIILGSLSGASAWIIGPARGLHIACQESGLPYFFQKLNKRNMPVGILLIQGIIVTGLCMLFVVMPTINSGYWVLSNLTAQLALLFYILFFATAIRLRYKYPNIKRAFKIPGGKIGMWMVSGTGIITCLIAIFIGFIPPTQIAIGTVYTYEAILIVGIVFFCVIPFLLTVNLKKLWE